MAVSGSHKTPVGMQAPDFSLPDPLSGVTVNLSDYKDTPLLVIFICNHCPYVTHMIDALVASAVTLQQNGIKTIAISANDVLTYPMDGPYKMAELALNKNFSFPYLYDETQSVAKAYNAECTPDPFLFDASHSLYYRGQFDASRPNSGSESTGADLLAAATMMQKGNPAPDLPSPSVGCSIKWKTADRL